MAWPENKYYAVRWLDTQQLQEELISSEDILMVDGVHADDHTLSTVCVGSFLTVRDRITAAADYRTAVVLDTNPPGPYPAKKSRKTKLAGKYLHLEDMVYACNGETRGVH